MNIGFAWFARARGALRLWVALMLARVCAGAALDGRLAVVWAVVAAGACASGLLALAVLPIVPGVWVRPVRRREASNGRDGELAT
ncbi:hypothetical protein [Burkholderia sp. Ac-20379]|uniref:hypothetical protein n=1 Tax=Burkholderia sp. Ac-20379 TaxID=2703900 RepID=UPI0030DABDD7